jgi:hypothetical protein
MKLLHEKPRCSFYFWVKYTTDDFIFNKLNFVMIGQSNHALEAVGYKNAPSFIGV